MCSIGPQLSERLVSRELMITFSFLEMVYSRLETGRQPGFGGDAADAENENTKPAKRNAIGALLKRAI